MFEFALKIQLRPFAALNIIVYMTVVFLKLKSIEHKILLSPGFTIPCDTRQKHTRFCVAPRTTPWVVACQCANKKLFLSVVDPYPTPPTRRREGRAHVVWVTATGGLIRLMGKLWLLKSGNVRGEVWRSRQPFAVVVTFCFLAWSPDCGGQSHTPDSHRSGKYIFFPCPAACSGYKISYF